MREAFDHLKLAADVIYGLSARQSLSVSVPPSFAVRLAGAANVQILCSASRDRNLDFGGHETRRRGGAVAPDVAVRYGQGDYPGVRSEVLIEAGVIPICSPELLSGAHPLKTPADLAHHSLIHVTPSQMEEPRPDWLAWLASRKARGY